VKELFTAAERSFANKKMKTIKIHILVVFIFVVLLIFSALLFLSHRKALSIANEIMKPMLTDWAYYDTDFLPIGFLGEKDGPSWLILYDAEEAMVVGPISIQVSLFGKVIGTNPLDLRERMIPFVPNVPGQKYDNTL
jgi:hypothetical protein